jgi:adenylate cyclase
MAEIRKIAAILAADVVGFSRMASADEDRTLAQLRSLRSELIDPTVASQNGRVFKRTGDGALIEFRSVVEAVRCAISIQKAMIERNVGAPADQRIDFRIGIHLGDVVEESDGDLMGDGVNIAARLEGIAEPGAICLSEDAYRQVKARLDLAVADLGPTRLKNIAEPVRAYSLQVGMPAEARPAMQTGPPKPKQRWKLASLAAGIASLLMIAGVAWYFFGEKRPAAVVAINSPPAHLSIVVLPFKNLSGDPTQDYFADGVTDNLTTDLSRIRNSFVIANTTAWTYKGKTVDAKEIGKELGVRYVLEGSVQRDQNRVRVNAQLIKAETGAHLWAERFEEDVADLFKLQDEVVARLANTLDYQLVKAEAEKGARAKNPDVVDLTMRGNALFQLQPLTKDNNDAARAYFEQALTIDPSDVAALTGDAVAHLHEKQLGWSRPEIDYDAKILGQAQRAIALAPDVDLPYYAKSYYLFILHRNGEALGAASAGLAINANSAVLYGVRALVQNSLGHFEQAKSDITNAMRLSPHDPFMLFWPVFLGDAELGLGHFDAAVDAYHRSIDLGWRTFAPYIDLAAAYALQGKMEDARTNLAEARRLYPPLTVKWLQSVAPNIPNLFEGVRKAGLPEDASPSLAHLSVVVLPFTNLSGDPAQDYFADGVSENLTTDLAHISKSFVIARNTAFTFKGKNVDAKEVGKELGVRYVLEGSVQRDGARVRVNAQLIDAETGAHLWADRFDEDVADLFKLQDQIVARLANALGFELVKAEAEKSARSQNPDALDLAMRGWATMWRSYPQPVKEKRDSHNAALDLFVQALKIDPNDPDALAGEAFAYMALFVFGEAIGETDLDAKIIDTADRAIALAPDNMRAYHAKAAYLAVTRRANEALRAADSGLVINPSYAPLLDVRAVAETALGRFGQAKSDVQKAMSLSPRDPEIGSRVLALGLAELGLGNLDAAIVEFQKEIDAGDRTFIPYVNLAAAYALGGKLGQAKTALAEGQSLNPKLTIKWLADHAPNVPVLFDGLRKAGLAEE